jgi:hypothetical protein
VEGPHELSAVSGERRGVSAYSGVSPTCFVTACLEKTASGGDGPLITAACFLAFAEHVDGPLGAILITLMPHDIIGHWRSHTWKERPPPKAVERRLG